MHVQGVKSFPQTHAALYCFSILIIIYHCLRKNTNIYFINCYLKAFNLFSIIIQKYNDINNVYHDKQQMDTLIKM